MNYNVIAFHRTMVIYFMHEIKGCMIATGLMNGLKIVPHMLCGGTI